MLLNTSEILLFGIFVSYYKQHDCIFSGKIGRDGRGGRTGRPGPRGPQGPQGVQGDQGILYIVNYKLMVVRTLRIAELHFFLFI